MYPWPPKTCMPIRKLKCIQSGKECQRSKKRRRTNNSPSPPRENPGNRFSTLPIDVTGDAEQVKKEYKPPPLILYGVEDINKLIEAIETCLKKDEFNIKIISKNQLRVTCKATDAYKKLMNLVREKCLIGHTFTRKDERCYRIVIKNLHHTTPLDAIREEIEKTGNKVRGEIINARIGPEKIPSNTFFVNLEPGPKNKDVKNIQYIYHTVVKIEDPKRRKTVVQCTKCQQYGHTKNNCLRPYRCVKCADSHKTSECPRKDKSSPAKCALCLGEHTANYKGCEVYKEILERKRKAKAFRTNINQNHSEKTTERNTQSTNTPGYGNDLRSMKDFPPLRGKNVDPRAEPVTQPPEIRWNLDKNQNRPQSKPETQHNTYYVEPTQVLQDLVIKQTEKIDILLQQISSLVSLVTMLFGKLTK